MDPYEFERTVYSFLFFFPIFWEGKAHAVTFLFNQLFRCWKRSRPCLGSAVNGNGWDRTAEGRDNFGSYKQTGHDRQCTNRCTAVYPVLLRRPGSGTIKLSSTLQTLV